MDLTPNYTKVTGPLLWLEKTLGLTTAAVRKADKDLNSIRVIKPLWMVVQSIPGVVEILEGYLQNHKVAPGKLPKLLGNFIFSNNEGSLHTFYRLGKDVHASIIGLFGYSERGVTNLRSLNYIAKKLVHEVTHIIDDFLKLDMDQDRRTGDPLKDAWDPKYKELPSELRAKQNELKFKSRKK